MYIFNNENPLLDLPKQISSVIVYLFVHGRGRYMIAIELFCYYTIISTYIQCANAITVLEGFFRLIF